MHGFYFASGDVVEGRFFREVVSDQSVEVLVGTSFPTVVGARKVVFAPQNFADFTRRDRRWILGRLRIINQEVSFSQVDVPVVDSVKIF